jgi:adenylate kinase
MAEKSVGVSIHDLGHAIAKYSQNKFTDNCALFEVHFYAYINSKLELARKKLHAQKKLDNHDRLRKYTREECQLLLALACEALNSESQQKKGERYRVTFPQSASAHILRQLFSAK